MKQKSKSRSWTVAVSMLLVTIVVLAGSLMPYLEIDISTVMKFLPNGAADVFNEIIEILGGRKGIISFSAVTLIRAAVYAGENSAAASVLISLGIIIMLPYLMVFLAAASGLLRKGWSYIVAAVFAVGGFVLNIMTITVFIPSCIYQIIPDTLSELIEILPSEFGKDTLRKMIMDGIGAAWWISLIGCAVLGVLAIIGFLALGRKKNAVLPENSMENLNKQTESESVRFAENSVQGKEMRWNGMESQAEDTFGISIGFGELNGCEISMKDGETIVIGKDSRQCNVVALEEEISEVHCRIRCDGKNGCYLVMDCSGSGVYIDGKKLISGKNVRVAPGSILFLANKYIVGLL